MVIESGATVHMFNISVLEQNSIVLLGDGVSFLPVNGIGTAIIYVNSKPIILPDSFYIPDLEVTLYSILEHACHKGNTFSSDIPEQHMLTWPNASAIANRTEELTFESTISPVST
eukprot:4766064-Ditylum_brightwellii.AAC.1